MVQELVIGWTTGGGTLEILRIEVNPCDLSAMESQLCICSECCGDAPSNILVIVGFADMPRMQQRSMEPEI